jgi:hypothetical protein
MALGTAAMIGVAGGAAALGGISGAIGSKTEQTQTSRVDAGSATDLENQGSGMLSGGASQLQGMVNAGPGQSDVTNSLGASHDLASMLQQYSQSGGLPTGQDISNSNDIASKLFATQRTQMSQNFMDQTNQANQQAALMGRSINDPILRNKLAQEQTRQQSVLDAQQGGFATQFALNQPMQRLGFASQRADVLGGLASQAMANRQALAGMGSSIMNQERSMRLATATRTGTQTQSSGGGVSGAINGAMGGLGTGLSAAGMFGAGGAFGGGGGGVGQGMPPMTPGFQGAANYFNSNPYSGGGGFTPQQAPSFGAQMPRQPSLGNFGYGGWH